MVSPTAKSTWKFAGWLNQQISTTLPVKNGVADVERGKRLWLSKVQVIEFDPIIEDYQVSINFPHWLSTVEVAIWQTERVTSRGVSQRMIMEGIDLKLSEIDFQKIIAKLDNLPSISLP